jgi:hypothetical protein
MKSVVTTTNLFTQKNNLSKAGKKEVMSWIVKKMIGEPNANGLTFVKKFAQCYMCA